MKIFNQKIEDWLTSYDGPKFHAVLCDPPYGLEFMGKEWDKFDVRQPGDATFHKSGVGPFDRSKVRHSTSSSYGDSAKALAGFQMRVTAWGEAILPHLYPGALVLMFGGTRTWHRLACGMEDAGFEIWDTMMWLHGQGFPKAQKIEGWQGYKTTALKPAWEPVLCFKKPLTGTYAEMAMQYGSGALNVDGGRIATDEALSVGAGGLFSHIRDGKPYPNGRNGEASADRRYTEEGSTNFAATPGPRGGDPSGRYPPNLILDPESASMLDEQTGELTSGEPMGMKAGGQLNCYGVYAGGVPVTGFGDSGGASRFYYCAKSSSSERNAGLDDFDAKVKSADYRQPTGNAMVDRIHGCGIPKKNHHPTVKPIDLCRYLATLLLPPDSVQPRRLLIPFAGSGSEMIGAMLAGWDEIVGVEQDTEHGYVQIAEARLEWWKWAKETSRLTDPAAILQRFGLSDEPDENQPSLFASPEQLSL